ncbi:MAG: hypothetical protein ABWK05_02555 [Pyrobaculum sp.]
MEYLARVVNYVMHKAVADKGSVVVVRTWEICGVDRKCGWHVYVVMQMIQRRGLAYKHKRGVYIIERGNVPKVLSLLKEKLPRAVKR